VAIKFLRPDLLKDRTIVEKFLVEARAAKAIQHPNLVRLLGLAEIQGKKAAVMEYVEGFTLAALFQRNKRLSLKQGLDLLSMLCVALGQSHKAKLLHRDVKMTNILVAKGGGLRLAGVGLGALRTAQLGPADGYPAPELLAGKPIDPRSDIYSVGALIFHVLSGTHPLQQTGAPPSLRTIVPEIPEALDQILARCLAEQPAERFSHVGELFNAAKALR
jgi:serine/threonine-protein kinase